MADDWLSDEWNEDDLPEWLRGADEAPEEPAAPEQPELPEQPPAPESAEALPGWLTGAEPGEPVAAEPPPALGDESFAWLTEDAGEAEAAAEPTDEGEIPDWLADVAPAEAESPPEAPPPGMTFDAWQAQIDAPPPDEFAGAVPDWFDDVEEKLPEPPAGEETAFAPEWFMGLEDQPEAEAPDWFHEVDLSGGTDLLGDTGSLADKLLGETPPAPAEEPVPEWFADVETPAGGTAGTDQDDSELAWLAGLGAPEEASEEAPSLEDEPEPALDWLADAGEADLGEADLGAPVDEAEAAPEAEVGELEPDWMADFGVPAGEAEAAPEAEAGELEPDWMADFGAPVDEAEAAPEAEAGEAEPDWMADFGVPAGEAEAAPEAEAGELEPDWMAALGGLDEAEAAPEAAAPEAETLDWMADLGALDEALPEVPAALEADDEAPAPDWMAEFGAPVTAGEVPPPVDEGETPEPGWMAEFDLPTADAAPLPEPALEEDMPGWLAEMRPAGLDDVEAVEAVEETGEEEALAPAEVPGWLEAVRPAEHFERWGASAPEEAEAPEWAEPLSPLAGALAAADDIAREESAGPLVGLKGTLLAEPMMSVPGAPELVTARVVTEEDQRQANLLAAITRDLLEGLEEEEEAGAEARPAPARRRVRIPFGRIAISLLLVVALAVPFFVAIDLGAPAGLAAPAQEVVNQIDAVPAGSQVLLAFEHGAAEAAELEPAARAVVARLVDRGARIVLLTANPVGALIGNRLVADVTQGGGEVVNLGYLAGYLGGLRSLVARDENPQAAAPLRFGFDYRGEASGLDVNTLRESFRLIVVLPGQLDALRAWVEQVDSVTGREDLPGQPIPMVAVVGAGSEPVAAAYYESGQLEGYVTGYKDAYIYAIEQNAGDTLFVNPEACRVAVTLGAVAAAGVIAVGSVGYALRGLLGRRRRRRR